MNTFYHTDDRAIEQGYPCSRNPSRVNMAKYVAQEMLVEAGVDIFFHVFIRDILKEGNNVTGVTLSAKDKDYTFRSKVVINCSGDGDVAVKAGADYVYGDAATHKAQPGSVMFEMADVDVDKVYDYICANPDDFEFKSDCVPLRPYDDRLKQHYFVAQGFKKLVKQAVDAGELKFGRDSIIVLNSVQPREIDPKAVQEQLLAFGASLWRDKEKTAREQAHATKCVKVYIKGRDKFITRDDVLKKYQD